MSVSWVVLEWYLSHDFIVGNKNLSSCKSVYYVLYKCCFLLFSQVLLANTKVLKDILQYHIVSHFSCNIGNEKDTFTYVL